MTAVDVPAQPTPSPELGELYEGFARERLLPLWTQLDDLMPAGGA